MSLLTELPLPVDIIIWFAASIVCTSGSKFLLQKEWLAISTLTGKLLFTSGFIDDNSSESKGRDSLRSSKLYLALALSFIMGFGSLNASFAYIPVSLAMTLRATEPLFTALLVSCNLANTGREAVSTRILATLVPVVGGAALASYGSAEFSMKGLFLVCVANFAFPLRMMLFKQVQEATNHGVFQIFYNVCWRAAFLMMIANSVIDMVGSDSQVPSTIQFLLGNKPQDILIDYYPSIILILINGICYFAYLQWSFIVQSKVTLLTHAVCNALRRPVNIVFSVWYFGTKINALNTAGIVMASVGAILYSRAKAEVQK